MKAHFLLNIVLAFMLGIAAVSAVPFQKASAAGQVTLLFYDRNGTALSVNQVRALSNGPGRGYDNDALLNPQNLQMVQYLPLTTVGSNLVFTVPSVPVAFAFNWPQQPNGYSLLILDNGGGGFTGAATVNFTYQAALDYKRRLDASLAERPTYVPSTAFTAAYNDAAAHITTANASGDQAVKGKEGQLALDQLDVAYMTLLDEYGPQLAKANKATQAPWIAFTFDSISNYQTNMDLVARIAGPFAWIRIVFDLNMAPSAYVPAVAYAQSIGIHVVCQPVDSFYDKRLKRAQYVQRFKDYMAAMPNCDMWELGNEVNGSWLSADIANKVADAAAYVKSQGKKSLLTLFWQINTDNATYSMFNWANNTLPASVKNNVDVITMSVYIEQAPLGIAFEQVMDQLAADWPNSKIAIGELDYWLKGQSFWWAYNQTDPRGPSPTSGIHIVARHFYNGGLAFPRSVGGSFWWYFLQEFPGDPELQATVSNLRDQLNNP